MPFICCFSVCFLWDGVLLLLLFFYFFEFACGRCCFVLFSSLEKEPEDIQPK